MDLLNKKKIECIIYVIISVPATTNSCVLTSLEHKSCHVVTLQQPRTHKPPESAFCDSGFHKWQHESIRKQGKDNKEEETKARTKMN